MRWEICDSVNNVSPEGWKQLCPFKYTLGSHMDYILTPQENLKKHFDSIKWNEWEFYIV